MSKGHQFNEFQEAARALQDLIDGNPNLSDEEYSEGSQKVRDLLEAARNFDNENTLDQLAKLAVTADRIRQGIAGAEGAIRNMQTFGQAMTVVNALLAITLGIAAGNPSAILEAINTIERILPK
ncbi:MAG: hypothetical protein AB7D57_13725 [Desulfovibrionaceae bacterium]